MSDPMTAEQIASVLEGHECWLNGAGGERAILRNANLRSANLVRANLVRANLVDANLRSANLVDANLVDANLVDANLVDANLMGAKNIEHASWEAASLTRARGDGPIVQVGPVGSRGDSLIYFAAQDHAVAGCWSGTLAELKERVRETHVEDSDARRSYEAAFAFIHEIVPAETIRL